MPSITKMNDPDTPGRIIAQIATAPTKVNTTQDLVTTSAPEASVSSRRPSNKNNAIATVAAVATWRAVIAPIVRQATTTEPPTKPRNTAAVRTGWLCNNSSITDDNTAIAAKIPTSSDTNHTQDTRRNAANPPEIEPVNNNRRAPAPARTSAIKRS